MLKIQELDEIQKRLLREVADLHRVPEGAYNIRSNSQSAGRASTENIEIIPKEAGSGLDIRIKARLQADNAALADVDVKVLVTTDATAVVSGKLQVWVTEDGIVAEQDDMGQHIADYVHDHVLRDALNGDWGEDISLTGGYGDTRELHYTLQLKPAWNPDNLAIVAFVYNDNEVLQAARATLKTNK